MNIEKTNNKSYSSWKKLLLKDFCKKCIVKNTDKKHSLVFTNSAIYGIVKQADYFEKDVANSDNTDSYYVVNTKDFIYNPRISENAPYGPIRTNETGEVGIVSPLYFVFRIADETIAYYNFLKYYFTSSNWHRYVYSIGNNGARSDRMNISDADFMVMPVALPPLEEQRRIAKILGCCDRVIALKKELIAEKKKQKKALMQKIFVAAQSCVKLETLSEIIMGQSPPSEAYNKNRIGVPLIQGNADIVNRNFQARMWTNIITQTCKKHDIIISVRAPVGTVAKASCDACIGRGVAAIRVIENPEYIFQYLLFYEDKWQKISQGSTFDSIGGKEIKSLSIPLFDTITQKRIADILSAADKEIDLLEQEIAQQEQKKKSLMQLLLTGIVRV